MFGVAPQHFMCILKEIHECVNPWVVSEPVNTGEQVNESVKSNENKQTRPSSVALPSCLLPLPYPPTFHIIQLNIVPHCHHHSPLIFP